MKDLCLEALGRKPAALQFGSDFHQLSHDLRTPLNHINGFAELLLMNGDLNPECADYVRAILSGSAALNDIVISHLEDAEGRAPEAPVPAKRSDAKKRYLGMKPGSWAPSPAARKVRPESVMGPLGQPMTLESLPPPDTKRWIAQRKAELVAAVEGGLLTIEEVCERYRIALEEFVSWQRGLERLGMRGLWLKRMQKDRNLSRRRQSLMCAPGLTRDLRRQNSAEGRQ